MKIKTITIALVLTIFVGGMWYGSVPYKWNIQSGNNRVIRA